MTHEYFKDLLPLGLAEVLVICVHPENIGGARANSSAIATFLVVLDFALRLLLDDLVLHIIDALAEDLLELVLLINFLGAQRLDVSQALLLLIEDFLKSKDQVFEPSELRMLKREASTVGAATHKVQSTVRDAS